VGAKDLWWRSRTPAFEYIRGEAATIIRDTVRDFASNVPEGDGTAAPPEILRSRPL